MCEKPKEKKKKKWPWGDEVPPWLQNVIPQRRYSVVECAFLIGLSDRTVYNAIHKNSKWRLPIKIRRGAKGKPQFLGADIIEYNNS